MKIYFCCTDFKAEPWLAALRAALPQAQIEAWAPGAPPGDYAVVWAPPQTFLDEQPQLKALFNLGAGVDALTQLRLPVTTKLVRLDDAGMSVQMAEYVVHALIRHFREFDGYAADVGQGKWSFRKPRLREDFPVGIMGLGVLGEEGRGTLDHLGLGQDDVPILIGTLVQETEFTPLIKQVRVEPLEEFAVDVLRALAAQGVAHGARRAGGRGAGRWCRWSPGRWRARTPSCGPPPARRRPVAHVVAGRASIGLGGRRDRVVRLDGLNHGGASFRGSAHHAIEGIGCGRVRRAGSRSR